MITIAKHTTLSSLFTAIANAIRAKKGSTDQIVADDFPDEISALSNAEPAVIEPLDVTENGTYTAPEGVDGYSPVTVNVEPDVETETWEFTLEDDSIVTKEVQLVVGNEAEGGITPTGTKTITTNGTYDVTNYATAKVNVPSDIPEDYADVSSVTATAADVLAPKKIVLADGTQTTGTITTKTASNLTVIGSTVAVPAGYYASNTTKSVTTATQAIPSIDVSSSGLITASATQSAGYVSGGTKSGTRQLTTKGADTITPGTSEKTAVASGVYTTGTIKVAGDADLKAENIKSGVSIFGVTGTYTGSSGSGASVVEVTGTSNSSGTLIIDLTTTGLKCIFVIIDSGGSTVNTRDSLYGTNSIYYAIGSGAPTISYTEITSTDEITMSNSIDYSVSVNVYSNQIVFRDLVGISSSSNNICYAIYG